MYGPAHPALLVVAHGSRDPRHAATVHALVRQVRSQRPGVRVGTAFLDFNAPAVPRVLERMANDAVAQVVALPLLLARAFHAKSDIPSVLDEARARHPRLRITQAGVLGPSRLLLDTVEQRLYEAGLTPADKGSTGVVLASAGSSDPEAASGLAEVARDLRHSGWRTVRPAFASAVTAAGPPAPGDAVRALRAAGAEGAGGSEPLKRVAVAPYVIAPGRLPDRIADGARAAGADVLADVLGPSPALARLVLRRYDEALAVQRLAAAG
ncbi:sirohydrochlorin chelatase [Streptomyces pacificus]|uniref:Sirohydrochlorin chelatase n=1 Tax=Streptomyces pacificus TaxID=2705029 RepID=A0A6A0B033_9ACTN|nr:sirohydrochlorin chelatase [Streptomyces pacificus]GFH37594.1 sirohydrochlorin chelatase [Streptomyces pacificus]